MTRHAAGSHLALFAFVWATALCSQNAARAAAASPAPDPDRPETTGAQAVPAWSPPRVVGDELDGELDADVAVRPDGSSAVVYANGAAVKYTVLDPAVTGAVVVAPTVLFPAATDFHIVLSPRIAVTGTGATYVAWEHGGFGTWRRPESEIGVCEVRGAACAQVWTVRTGRRVMPGVRIAADEHGRVAVLWGETDWETGAHQLGYAEYVPGEGWTSEFLTLSAELVDMELTLHSSAVGRAVVVGYVTLDWDHPLTQHYAVGLRTPDGAFRWDSSGILPGDSWRISAGGGQLDVPFMLANSHCTGGGPGECGVYAFTAWTLDAGGIQGTTLFPDTHGVLSNGLDLVAVAATEGGILMSPWRTRDGRWGAVETLPHAASAAAVDAREGTTSLLWWDESGGGEGGDPRKLYFMSRRRRRECGISAKAQAIVDRLQESYEAQRGHGLWNLTCGNSIGPANIIESPRGLSNVPPSDGDTCLPGEPGCDPQFQLRTCNPEAENACSPAATCRELGATLADVDGTPKWLCVGTEHFLLDHVHGMFAHAREHVDFAALGPPSGAFVEAIRNGLKYKLSRMRASDPPFSVRLVTGTKDLSTLAPLVQDPVLRLADASGRIQAMARNMGNADDPPFLGFALQSWNHSKIIVRDGIEAIVGSHMWVRGDITVGAETFSEVSLRLKGPAARDANRYVDRIWARLCEEDPTIPAWACAGRRPMEPGAPGNTGIISAGSTGSSYDDLAVGEDAVLALIGAARRTVHIANQAVVMRPVSRAATPLYMESDALIEAIAQALLRGVTVRILVSEAQDDDGRIPADQVAWFRQQVLDEFPFAPPGYASVEAFVDEWFQIAALPARVNGTAVLLHEKTIVVDDEIVYVGSQTTYPGSLRVDEEIAWPLFNYGFHHADFGYIVDDPELAGALRIGHWQPLWDHAVSPPDPGGRNR